MKALSGRPKRCKVCRSEFMPKQYFQAFCSVECGLKLAQAKQSKERAKLDKAERKEIKARKEKLKRRGDYLRDAQKAFNEYIRWRDRVAGHPCISSGEPLDWSGNQTDAGHYRSTGSAPHLRFDERNCHAQRKLDNRFLSGNAVDYRIGLIARIGLEAVEALESDQAQRKYTIDDLKAITAKYRSMVRELKSKNS